MHALRLGWLPCLVLAGTLSMTWLAWDHERQATQKELHNQFDFALRETVSRIEQRVMSYEQLLRGVQGMIATTDLKTDLKNRRAFSDYVGALQLDANFSGIQAIGIAEHVTAGQRAEHIAAMRRLGFKEYALIPPGDRANYAPVVQREPDSGHNHIPPGFDAWSEAERRAAMERARDSGMTAISGKVKLAVDAEREDRPGFIMYLPIYRRDQPHDSVAQRREHITGWVYASFRMSEVIGSLYGEQVPGLDFAIFDGVELTPDERLYEFSKAGTTKKSNTFTLTANEYLVVGGHTWTLQMTAGDDFESRFGNNSAQVILGTGVGLSLLLTLLVMMIMKSRANSLQLAVSTTEELTQSEARFKTFFEKNSSVMLLIDPQSGKITEANETAATFYGYSRSQLIGMPISEINTHSPEEVAELMRKATQEDRSYFVFRHRLASGLIRDVEVHPTPIISRGVPLLFSIIHDITERKEAEQREVETLRTSERLLEERVKERTAELSVTIERLKQTQSDLVQADKLASLGALVAGVAHELNTPIGNALTVASSLEDAATDFEERIKAEGLRRSELTTYAKNTRNMAGLVARSCQRVASLVTSFKQVAVDQTSEHRRQFDLRSLVEDNITALRPSFRLSPWVIESEIPPGITCDSYPGPLGQVIVNLVQNAVTHAFDGRTHGRLQVTAEYSDDTVEMVFADDGRGMYPEILVHIFEPFFTTRLGQGGSGLGLSISRNIVTGVLGGTLHVSSEPDQGTQFTLTFPRLAPNTPATFMEPRKDRRRQDASATSHGAV